MKEGKSLRWTMILFIANKDEYEPVLLDLDPQIQCRTFWRSSVLNDETSHPEIQQE